MQETNPNARLEMFSDGVFAIAITLLIIEIKVPSWHDMQSVSDVWNHIAHLWPSFLALALSFVIIFISWYGHHYFLASLDKTSTRFQFGNGFFLLTLVILPFSTAFMAEFLDTPYAQPAIIFYNLNCILHNLGWRVLIHSALKPVPLARTEAHRNFLKRADKGNLMGTGILIGITALAWWFPYLAICLNILLWSYWVLLTYRGRMEAAA